MGNWSNRYPGVVSRPTLLSAPAQQGVREMAARRLVTPCDILDEVDTESETGGVGEKSIVILASLLCDVEPYSRTDQEPPNGFEEGKLYRVYLPRAQSVPSDARIAVPGWLPRWASTQSVALESRRVATGERGNGHWYECIQAGVTGPEEPLWDTRTGAVVVDGSALWKEAGAAFTLDVKQTDIERSRDTLLCVIAQLLK